MSNFMKIPPLRTDFIPCGQTDGWHDKANSSF